MTEGTFFEVIEQQHKNNLPFVVYSRPINSIIKCWLQKDDQLHVTENFTESGFVFSPFNLDQSSILLPAAQCKYAALEISNLKHTQTQHYSGFKDPGMEQHIQLVKKGITAIKKDELSKVVLSRVIQRPIKSSDPISIFKRLFNTYKNAMVYCWYHPKVGLWIGATPELLFKVEGKRCTMISLAGTQPYANSESTSWTKKEQEEQQIVTDYIVNHIAPFSTSINVSEVDTVRAGNLLHLKSYIYSVIKDEYSLKSIIHALHPTPAVCGFPKKQAKEFIIKNENYQREYYTGFLGELNVKQTTIRNTNRRNVENNAYTSVKTTSNFYVNLRCAQLKNNIACIYVGGGITKDSDPEKEWFETVNKTKTIDAILN